MDETYRKAGEGLRLVFWGEILAIASSLLFYLIPLLRLLGMLGGLILHLVGLNIAAKGYEGYRNAFNISIAALFVGLLDGLVQEGFLGLLVGIASLAVTLGEVYFVCTATAELLQGKDSTQAAKGLEIWKLYLGCSVVMMVCAVLAVVPIVGLLAGLALVVTAIVALVAAVMYLFYLNSASRSLLR